MEAPRRLRKAVNRSLTRRRQEAATAYHEIVKVLRSVAIRAPNFPRNVGARWQELERRGAILPLARTASYVTISSS